MCGGASSTHFTVVKMAGASIIEAGASGDLEQLKGELKSFFLLFLHLFLGFYISDSDTQQLETRLTISENSGKYVMNTVTSLLAGMSCITWLKLEILRFANS